MPSQAAHRRTRRFGQNFLISLSVAQRIVELANLDPEHDIVLEIGPGTGILTQVLVHKAKRVVAVEIDPSLAEKSRQVASNRGNLSVVEGDFLDVDFPACTKVVANLPYAISSPVTFHLIAHREKWTECILMYQKEFADRLCAPPGSENYSRLSAGVQNFLVVDSLMAVSRRNFTPAPKVDSVVVRFRHVHPPPPVPPAIYLSVTHGIFPYKNKTLRHALQLMLKREGRRWNQIEQDLALGDVGRRRVRTLTPPEINELSGKLAKLNLLKKNGN